MPIIVLEGPDESGKTTLAKYLASELGQVIETEMQRSPVKHHGWSHEYDHYLNNLIRVTNRHLVIQDRIPEISESIYGHMRGNPRTHGWVYEAGEWFHSPVFLIFCEGPAVLEASHKDVEGLTVAHPEIGLLYDYTFYQLEQTATMARLTDFRITWYNRFDSDHSRLMWEISSWLAHQWPNKKIQFEAAVEKVRQGINDPA